MPPRPSPASNGIRGAYETFGVQGFYEAHGQAYSNPHNDQIIKAVAALMSSQQFGEQPDQQLRVFDLACGSGEATLALQAWASSVPQRTQQQAQRAQQMQTQTQTQQLLQQQQEEQQLPGWRSDTGGAACSVAGPLDITACDPYTHEAYLRRTGRTAQHWSFQDIADGCLAGGAGSSPPGCTRPSCSHGVAGQQLACSAGRHHAGTSTAAAP